MRKVCLAILALLIALPVLAQLNAGPDNSPKVGDAAPDFPIPAAQRGQPAGALKDFQGKKNVLLMFFPGAFTPGCTTEFTEAGQQYDKFTALNVEMLGISADLPGAQNKFKETVGAKNSFVSDRSLGFSGRNDAVPPIPALLLPIDQTERSSGRAAHRDPQIAAHKSARHWGERKAGDPGLIRIRGSRPEPTFRGPVPLPTFSRRVRG
jgi:peroxiredoxin